MEHIEGELHSETKQKRKVISEKKIINQSEDTHEFHSEKEIQSNSGEKTKSH